MPRLRSSILIDALVRLAAQKGGAAYVRRKGDEAAGSIYITLYDVESRSYSLFEPTPQFLLMEREELTADRVFSLLNADQDDLSLSAFFEKESRMDPDFWAIDLEGVSQGDLSEIVQIL